MPHYLIYHMNEIDNLNPVPKHLPLSHHKIVFICLVAILLTVSFFIGLVTGLNKQIDLAGTVPDLVSAGQILKDRKSVV